MPGYKFGVRSNLRKRGLHPDLIKVIDLGLFYSEVDATILEGLRTRKRQQELFDIGATTTMKSRHLSGHAVDIAPLFRGQPSFAWPLYRPLAVAMKKASKELGIPIEWGGDWRTFKDGPHWQLPWKSYPIVGS